MSIALIIAGGMGSRSGQAIPKQFLTVKEKPILVYTLEKFERCQLVDSIYVAVNDKYAAITEDYINQFKIAKVKKIIQAGSTRNKSICNALEMVKELHGRNETIVIHHANMPFVKENEISMVIDKVNRNNIVIAGAEQYDYLLNMSGEDKALLIERENVVQLRTPEAMILENAIKIYEDNLKEEESKASPFIFMTDNSLAHELSIDIVKCSNLNFKITTPEDFMMTKAMLLSGMD